VLNGHSPVSGGSLLAPNQPGGHALN